jgi:hypothetical protein
MGLHIRGRGIGGGLDTLLMSMAEGLLEDEEKKEDAES